MNTDKKYIIWLGSIVEEQKVEQYQAFSAAGNKWQSRFIKALNMQNDIKVVCFGHRNERSFPKGKLFVGFDLESYPNEILQKRVPFVNIPYLRNIVINSFLICRTLTFLFKNRQNIHSIFSYNLYSYNFSVPFLFKYIFKIKWICIVADPINDNTDKINPLFRYSNGSIFLSKHLFDQSKIKHKIHIEGGIVPLKDLQKYEDNTKKYILYTGKVSTINGIDLLLEAFDLINDKNVNLIITGPCSSPDFENRIIGNSKIVYLGLIPENELSNLYINAAVLINPRLISEKANGSIFPSKLLEYLSYGKPIISTLTKGIPNEYNEVIMFIENDSPIELANQIDNLLNWSEEKIIMHRLKINHFIMNSKTWEKGAHKTLKWVEECNV